MPSISTVITLLLLPQKEAGRLNTLVKFQPEFSPLDGQFSAGNNSQLPSGTRTLVAGSLRAGKRAAAIMSLIQSARLNGHEPFAYLKDVLTSLPTQPQGRIGELLPHRWGPDSA